MNLKKEDIYNVVPKDVIQDIFEEFQLDLLEGAHGFYHWSRVIENGLLLSEDNNANLNVIIAFGLFHDCKRENDHEDPEHGFRGGQILMQYKDRINLTEEEINKAIIACEGHTDVLFHNDIDISTCWDSDRLDLMRVGIYPDPDLLNNDLAKEDWIIEQRSEIAEEWQEPQWAIDLIDDIQTSLKLDLETFNIKYSTGTSQDKKYIIKKPKF